MIRKPNLLLIRGLSHSGTTILDLALGAHPRIAGLGEAARVLEVQPQDAGRPPELVRGELRFRRKCSCQLPAAQCPVWGPYLDWLIPNDAAPFVEKTKKLLETVAEANASGPEPLTWVVDSAQSDRKMPRLALEDTEIRIVYLIRDVRSWCNSRCRKTGQSPIRAVAEWSVHNSRLDRFLGETGLPIFRLGYEELALAPVKALSSLCQWLSLDFDEAMLAPLTNTKSHVIVGNRARGRATSAAITYDGAWLGSGSGLVQAAAAMPLVGSMNRRYVYGNGFLKK